MEIPRHDTPTAALVSRGFGGEVDASRLAECMHLLRISKCLLHHFYTHFSAHALSPGKYSVLCELLAADAPMTPSLLAERIGVSRAAVTGIIDGLIKQKLVKRSTRPGDRRRLDIRLTEAGRQFLEEFLPAQYAQMISVFDGLSAAEISELSGILARIEENLS